MPTYQYVCTACSEDLEAVQSFTDAALTECPACGGRLRKRFGSVGVVFKGSGFYRNDSRAGNEAKAAAANGEKKADSKSEGTAAPSGDSGTSGGSESSSSKEPKGAGKADASGSKSGGSKSGGSDGGSKSGGSSTTPSAA